MSTTLKVLAFATQAEATQWMFDTVDDPCVDNFRFVFEGDEAAVEAYWEQSDEGCCGSFDKKIFVEGKPAIIGCNYGH